jgi:serine/threonine protein kinase
VNVESGEVVIIDFGFACAGASGCASASARAVGTAEYAAPEVYRSEAHTLDALQRADLWALGLMYSDMRGAPNPVRAEFEARGGGKSMKDYLAARYNAADWAGGAWPNVGAGRSALDQLVARLLSVDPSKRAVWRKGS